jgi:hypothetical protein
MKLKSTIFTFSFAMFNVLVFSQGTTQTYSIAVQTEKQNINYRHSIGSTLFLLGNIGDSVNYFQLN